MPLFFVYNILEEKLEQNRYSPILSKIYFPELYRTQSLQKDLRFFYGSHWCRQLKISQAGKEYVQRIRETGNSHPELLVAHAYTRYLGDLSGGQVMKKVVQKVLHLSDGPGLSFYNFEAIPDKKVFKCKCVLDSLPIGYDTANEIAVEANLAFKLNMNLFKQMQGHLIRTIGQKIYDKLGNA